MIFIQGFGKKMHRLKLFRIPHGTRRSVLNSCDIAHGSEKEEF